MSVTSTTQQRINREIRAREVRVIDNEGNQLGVLSLNAAIQAGWDRDLDLVEVAPTAVPPVCRILDFGKFKYSQAKKTQESKKHQRIIKIKEIKMRPKIEVHDYDFKKGHVMRFLSEGHRVKVTIMFRGREMARTHLGRNILDRLTNDLAPYAAMENPPRLEGRNMYVYLVVKPGPVFPDSVVHAAQHEALNVKGLPIYNPTLAVEAVGFREHEGRHIGVMVTPWFMNLTVRPSAEDLKVWVAGGTTRLSFPSDVYDFVVTDLHDVGLIGTCSLFSTMLEFTDHEAAQLSAKTVADAVFEPEQPAPAPTVSRRQLLGG